MKPMKRADRRWRTTLKRKSRLKRIVEQDFFGYRYDWTNRRIRSYAETSDFIEKTQPFWLETPTLCSCSICSYKNSWNFKKDRRKMRDEGRKKVDEFYDTCYIEENEEDL